MRKNQYESKTKHIFNIKAYDILSLTFILILIAIVVIFKKQIPLAQNLLKTYILLITFTLLSTIYTKKETILPTIHKIYPIVVIPIIFNSLGDVSYYLHGKAYDALLIKIDLFLCKHHPILWLCNFIKPWLSNLLYIAYSTYYFIPIIVGISTFNETKKYEKVLFYIIFGFYFSYIGYILLPAMGPRFTLNKLTPLPVDITTISKFINDTLNLLENNKYDAFPSGHTEIALISIYIALKIRKTKLALCLIPVVTALIISTIYCRYHYVTDVIAGGIWAYISIKLCDKLYKNEETSHDY